MTDKEYIENGIREALKKLAKRRDNEILSHPRMYPNKYRNMINLNSSFSKEVNHELQENNITSSAI